MTIKAEKPKRWTFDELRKIYSNNHNKKLGMRLLEILELAKAKGAFMESEAYYPAFGIRGKQGKRIMSFWSPEKNHIDPPGAVHLFTNLKRYINIDERNNLVWQLTPLLGYNYDLSDLNNISKSTTSNNSIIDLNEKAFREFINILQEYSFDSGAQ